MALIGVALGTFMPKFLWGGGREFIPSLAFLRDVSFFLHFFLVFLLGSTSVAPDDWSQKKQIKNPVFHCLTVHTAPLKLSPLSTKWTHSENGTPALWRSENGPNQAPECCLDIVVPPSFICFCFLLCFNVP